MAKFEGSSLFTWKFTAFFWKAPTTISVNPGQSPYKSAEMKNAITSPKIDIFEQKNCEV